MASDKMLGSFDQKSAPEDNDLLVEYDAAASKVKNVKFGGVWNWIVKKLTSAVINELQTSSKNVVGAINELNSNKQNTAMLIENTSNLYEYMFSNCGITGISFYSIPSAIEVENGSPDGAGGFGIAYKSSSENYGIIIIFSYNEAVYMKIKSVTWDNWKKVKFIK